MLEDKKIISKHKKLLDSIKKNNKHYYLDDKPKISDSDYDKIKLEILKLEKKYPYLKNDESIENIIGVKPSNKFKKIQHISPMLSLANAFDLNDMIEFKKKISNFLLINDKQIQLFCEPKIDGISATLIYKNGILTTGLSRGDGVIGEDILENLKTIKGLPTKIRSKDVPNLLEIRCEIYIGKKDFAKIDNKFANPRNAAGGTLRQKDFRETSKIPLK